MEEYNYNIRNIYNIRY